MKKVFSLFVTLCLLISSVPTFAEEAEKTIPDTWQEHEGFWVEQTDDAIRIMGLAGAADGGTLLVPAEMDSITPVKVEYPHGTFDRYATLPVQLSAEAFKGAENIETIKFLEGTEVIPAGLCESIKSLKTLQLPKTLKAIDNYAFKNCTALETVDLSNVQYIGRSAFEGCTSLESITVSANVNSIEDYAFKDCTNLKTVEGLHEGISIGQNVFTGTKLSLNEKNELVFFDVETDSEYYKATELLSSLGIMEGYGDKTFGLDKTLTRAEAAAIITRLFNCEDDIKQGMTSYTDVPKTHWASGYVNYAEENSIINGRGDGTFAPDEFVTYHQLIKMLVCALGYEPLAMVNGAWSYGGYITAAEEIGLIENEPENKDAFIPRGEAALMCYNALDIDFMELWQGCTGMGGLAFEILIGETILTAYWGMDYEEVREFYFEKTFGFELPENAECVKGEYFLENDGDKTCYMGKISFHEKDLDYIKQNLEKQDFAEGTLVEDSDVLQIAKHTRNAHTDWWDAGTFGTQKEHYHWIKEDKTYRYAHAVEFEAYIIREDTGTYWLYVYRYENEKSNV